MNIPQGLGIEPTALILIDVQKGFDDRKWGIRNNHEAEKNIAVILGHWRELRQPVIHIQHQSTELNSPLHPDAPGCEFKPEARPGHGELVFRKQVNSAFIGTGLEQQAPAKRSPSTRGPQSDLRLPCKGRVNPSL